MGRAPWSLDDLLASLRGLGLLRNSELARAYRSVDQARFLPRGLDALAYADMPLPAFAPLQGPTIPSARCLAVALELLEATPETRVLVDGSRGGYSAAVLAKVAGPENLVVVERDPKQLRIVQERLGASGLDDVEVDSKPPEGIFDRILVLEPSGSRARTLAGLLNDLGFLIARGRGVEDLAFVKIIRSGAETVRLTIGQTPPPALAGPRAPEGFAIDFARLFAVEDLLSHAWEGRIVGHHDQHFQDAVDETFADGPLDADSLDPLRDVAKVAARRSFQAAYILQSAGELERAADAYARSIRLAPSAEAHTFLGWTSSFMGDYAEAIEECKRAIQVDPTFGNPYNDIGAYLIELGRLDEAIPWLEKALAAPRYCCYFYAHTNLARAYLHKGLRERARRSLLAALDVNPDYAPARDLLRRLESEGYFA